METISDLRRYAFTDHFDQCYLLIFRAASLQFLHYQTKIHWQSITLPRNISYFFLYGEQFENTVYTIKHCCHSPDQFLSHHDHIFLIRQYNPLLLIILLTLTTVE